MPETYYKYTARGKSGELFKGVMAANSKEELSDRLERMGYMLTTAVIRRNLAISRGSYKLKRKELISFTFLLSTFVGTGVPLLTGLKDIGKQSERPELRRLIEDICPKIEGGATLADALASYPENFSPLYISSVRIGEATGRLHEILEHLTTFLEWQAGLKSKITEATIYPVILVVLMTSITIFFFTFILPQFSVIFTTANIELPLPTKIMLGISNILKTYWYYLLGGAVLAGIGFKISLGTEKGRFYFDSIMLKIPVLGDLIRKVSMARFSYTLSIAVEAGVDIIKSFEIVQGAVGNSVVAKAVRGASAHINVGRSIAESLLETKQFPPMLARLVSVGETAGILDAALKKVNEYYDKEVTSTIKALFALMEPLVTIVMGIVVGAVVMSMFLPIFKLMSAVK